MRRAVSSLDRPFVVLLVFVLTTFATAASAGHWRATYDLAPDSNLNTINPGGTYDDPITGTLTIEYDAVTSGAALSSARLVAGIIDGTINQPAGVLTVSGANKNVLLPGIGGTPGTLSGVALNLAVVADHTTTGYLHCLDATGVGGFCDLFFGTPSSNTIPQGGTGTFALPTFNFAATAGVGDFTSTALVSMPQASVTTTVVYVGKEISRIWVANPTAVPMMGPLGIGAVFASLLAAGGLVARRRQ